MSQKFQASVSHRDDVSYVKLTGVIDEDNELPGLVEKIPAGTAVIDLAEVERINSCGVRDWVNWLGKLENQRTRIVLVSCSPAIVAQINLVNNFTGAGTVKSFYVPYFCPDCDQEKLLLAETNEMGPAPHGPPICRCDECDRVMDFDDLADSYFAFLGSQKAMAEADRVNGAIQALAPSADGKVRSRAPAVAGGVAVLAAATEVVCINDLTNTKTLAHFFKYDSVHKQFNGEISFSEKSIIINNKNIAVTAIKNPEELPWKQYEVDIVIESTGLVLSKTDLQKHISAGAKKVILSAPAKDDDVVSVVLGVNDDVITKDVTIISNASCTTNCAAPMLKVLKEFDIEEAYITTVHSYTNDQRIHDAPHKDLRRARAAAMSIIPTSTGAAKAITKIFPDLEGKIGGCGMRVPVPNGSLTDITCVLNKAVTVEQLNLAYKNAANTNLKHKNRWISLVCAAVLLFMVPVRAQVIGANDQPIHDAARIGSGKDVSVILKAQPAARDARTSQGSTPLHLAATDPDVSALMALLAAGADPNARDAEGATPLHMAAYTQNAKHSQLLLEGGADPYAKTNAGRDPTSMARKVMANEAAGVILLWILKGCQADKPC